MRQQQWCRGSGRKWTRLETCSGFRPLLTILKLRRRVAKKPKGHHEKDSSKINKTQVETITSGTASDDPAVSDVEKDSLPAGMDVLQAASKKATWYSLNLTAIVAAIGMFSSLDLGHWWRHSDKINTNANKSESSSASHVLLALCVQ